MAIMPDTPGRHAVGLDFNPSADPKIARLKELAAEMFDVVESHVPANDGTPQNARDRKLRDAALHDILVAQMMAVKVVATVK